MKIVTITQISNMGKGAVGLIVGFGALMQVPSFSAPVMQFGHYHPHIAAVTGTATLLAAFLTNPQVQKVLKIVTDDARPADTPPNP